VQQYAPAAQVFQQAAPAMMPPPPMAPSPEDQTSPEAMEGFYAEAPPPVPAAPMRPLPPGWIRRPVPYQGRKGRRVYLRCALWRGPRGLVPASAAQAPPVAAQAPPVVVQTAPPRPVRRIIRRQR
jgi:hypothetical protein